MRCFDLFHRSHDVLASGDRGGIALGADQHEIVVHHGIALDALALSDELFLRGAGVDKNNVGVAAACHVEGLAGSQGDDANLDASLLLIDRQQISEETRLFG